MKRNAFFGIVLYVFCTAFTNVYAQNLPIILGSVLETGTEIIRITPFAGVWINGIGFARIGVSTGSQKETYTDEVEVNETKRLDISAQIGYAISPERPYITASYVRNKAYSPHTDATWNELGLGIGYRFSFWQTAAIIIEAEHRWITEHYNRSQNAYISGRRLQMNFGLAVYPY